MKTVHSLCARALLGLAALGMSAGAQADYPEKDMRMIIPFGAGGGSDILARTIGAVIEELGLAPVRFTYENLPGASSARGYREASRRKGDPYTMATVSVSFFTTPLITRAPFSQDDFTPIAAISMAPYVLAVKADSPLRTLQDFAAAKRLTTGSVGVVSDARLLSDMLSKQLQVRVDVVPFEGEGEIVTGVLGKHIDFLFSNPSEVLTHIEAGTMRPIAVSAGQRLGSMPEVPTFKEQGYDIEHTMLRSVVMPAGVEPEVVAYWEDVLRKVAHSPQWKARYLDRYKDEPRFEDAKTAAASMRQTQARYTALLKELEIIK
ncbi:tripartite tricarboxylate transporter substrate binding protein [Orrella sp. JC864]|uniref:tripartite tricarboxylate transporter substrate binding protein n=1 Tax=Orrella sp. JC864 TaxID=3120298 RepID=UPI00300AB922